MNEEIGKMADYYRVTAEEVRASLTKEAGAIDNIRNNLKTRKAIEAVVAKAKITDGEWIDESSVPAADEAEKPVKETKKKETAKKPSVKKAAKEA